MLIDVTLRNGKTYEVDCSQMTYDDAKSMFVRWKEIGGNERAKASTHFGDIGENLLAVLMAKAAERLSHRGTKPPWRRELLYKEIA